MKTWIIQTVFALGLGVIGYFLKDLKKGIENQLSGLNSKIDTLKEKVEQDNKELEDRLDKRIKCIEERHEDLQRELIAYREHVNKNFTLKDDFIRAISGIDRKLDKITDLIMERRTGT